jgi:hypothetical protein
VAELANRSPEECCRIFQESLTARAAKWSYDGEDVAADSTGSRRDF